MDRIFRPTIVAIMLALATALPADAQVPFGSPWGAGYGGYGPWAQGYWPNRGLWGNNAYGPFNYGQQLYQQQSSLTQQIFQQQQRANLDQIQAAQERFARLDGLKQQMFVQYLGMNESDKAAVRAGLMNSYLSLDAQGREQWQRDPVAQLILGSDLQRLEGLSEVQTMTASDRTRLREAMLQKFRHLSGSEQQAWRNDPIVRALLGDGW
ncbi:MAG TPA: hypothetical protein VG713_01140 [Pirellulales bacterium]|nr:hypothetical protein [Pirellulales bacterium]